MSHKEIEMTKQVAHKYIEKCKECGGSGEYCPIGVHCNDPDSCHEPDKDPLDNEIIPHCIYICDCSHCNQGWVAKVSIEHGELCDCVSEDQECSKGVKVPIGTPEQIKEAIECLMKQVMFNSYDQSYGNKCQCGRTSWYHKFYWNDPKVVLRCANKKCNKIVNRGEK